MIKRFLWALALTMSSCGAYAETSVGVHIGSWHSEPGFNNVNPGVYVNHNGWTAGTYWNSLRKQSVYAGYTFEYKMFGLTVGAITGYPSPVLPLVVPSVKFASPFGGSMRVLYIPYIKQTGAHVLHLTQEWRF